MSNFRNILKKNLRNLGHFSVRKCRESEINKRQGLKNDCYENCFK